MTATVKAFSDEKAASLMFLSDERGWGIGLSVVASPVGKFGWDGGLGTSWYSDPSEDLVGILMTQRAWTSPDAPAVCVDFWTSAYQAIDD